MRFIFTGAPGSGKTSVLVQLEKLGYNVIHEAATDLIKESQQNGITQPWEEVTFIERIILTQEERQKKTLGALQLYDRSPFCTYALKKFLYELRHQEFLPSKILLNEIDRCIKEKIYHKKVFFFENLGFIKETEVRKIKMDEAILFERIHLEVYKSFGFEIMIIAKESVEKRTEFLHKYLSGNLKLVI